MKKLFILLLMLITQHSQAQDYLGMITSFLNIGGGNKNSEELDKATVINTSRTWRLSEYIHDEKAGISKFVQDYYKVAEIYAMAQECSDMSARIIKHPALSQDFVKANEVSFYRNRVDACNDNAYRYILELISIMTPGKLLKRNIDKMVVGAAVNGFAIGGDAWAMGDAVKALDEQFGNGEIDAEEYEKAKAKLKGSQWDIVKNMAGSILDVIGIGGMLGGSKGGVEDDYKVPLNEDVYRLTDGERIRTIDELHARMAATLAKLRNIERQITQAVSRRGETNHFYNTYNALYKKSKP